MADATTDTTTPTVDQTTQNTVDSINNINLTGTNSPYVAPTSTDLSNSGFATKDPSSYITDDMTVSGQLSKLLSSNSDYMKQVDAKSKITANDLGMLSTDRYIGAATGAAIREATPIAQADAELASKFGLQKQASDNALGQTSREGLVSGNLKSQDANLNQQTAKVQGAIESYLKGQSSSNDQSLATLNANLNKDIQVTLKNLDNELAKNLAQLNFDQIQFLTLL